MKFKPLHTEADYEAALQAVSPFFDNEPDEGTPESDNFEMLIILIEAYEAKHYPIAPPDPIEAILFRMEQAGLKPKDLTAQIGRINRVYEILGRTRPLTLPMIRRLHADLGIPAESLIAVPVSTLRTRASEKPR